MLYLYIGLGVVGFFLLGFLISIPVVTNFCYKKFFCRGKSDYNDELADAHYAPFRQEILKTREEIEKLPFAELSCRSYDGTELYARYYDRGGDKTVIFLHGVRSLPLNNFSVAAKRFMARGYNILLPDQRAHGRSGGTHITFGLRERYDLLAWIELLKTRSAAKIVLYGMSMGAATVGYASDIIAEGAVAAAVYDCGFISVDNIFKSIVKKYHAPAVLMKGLKNKCKRELNIDLDESAEEHLKNTKIPSIFVHGIADTAVSYENSKKYYDACSAPKELVLVEGRGHTTAAIGGEAPQKIDEFIKKYI